MKQRKYPGGDQAYANFVTKNFRYSDKDKENGVQGDVVLDVVIEKDGSTSSVTLHKSAHNDLDAEAVRVFKLMPKRIPGKKDGKPARLKFLCLLVLSTSMPIKKTSLTSPPTAYMYGSGHLLFINVHLIGLQSHQMRLSAGFSSGIKLD